MFVFNQFSKDQIVWDMRIEDVRFWNTRAIEKIQYSNNIDCLSSARMYDEETMARLNKMNDLMTRH